jgi:hypothetical protein
MDDAILGTRKRGRPATGATSVHLRIEPEQLAALDAWIASQPVKALSRPEAIRRLIDLAFAADHSFDPHGHKLRR